MGIRICIQAICQSCETSNPVPTLYRCRDVTYQLNARPCCNTPRVQFTFSEISRTAHIAGIILSYHSMHYILYIYLIPFKCVHCNSHVPGLSYESDPRGYIHYFPLRLTKIDGLYIYSYGAQGK